MKRKLFLLMLLILSFELQAQTPPTDSVALKTKLAYSDARHFKLDQDKWLAYKKHQIANTSDYFKPVAAQVSHPDLLTDSVYVKAFREAANRKTLKRRTTGHYILIGGGIFVVVVGLFSLIISAIFLADFN